MKKKKKESCKERTELELHRLLFDTWLFHMVWLCRRNKRKAIGAPQITWFGCAEETKEKQLGHRRSQWHTHGLYSTIFSPLFSLRRRLFPNGNYSFQAVITCFICSLTKAVGIYAACFICSLTKAVGKYAACFSTTGPAAHDCELWTWF